MRNKDNLKTWVLEAVDRLESPGALEVSRWIWENHEADLRAAGDLFYTWQYDVRWAAQVLRNEGVLAPAGRGSRSVWRRA